MNEEVVVILDASRSMGEEIRSNGNDQQETDDFLGTTKLDVARYIAQQLILHATSPCGPLQDQTKVLALITLGDGPSKHPSTGFPKYDEKTETNDSKTCCCYVTNETNLESSMDGFHAILQGIRAAKTSCCGDFVDGIHCATNAMFQSTTVGAARRRIVLVTDARQKVLQAKPNERDPMEALAETINRLSGIGCRLEVVGIGFSKGAFVSRTNSMEDTRLEAKKAGCDLEAGSEDEQDGDSLESDDESSEEEDEDDWSDVQDQNELLLLDLVEKVGGCVLAINGRTSIDGDNYGIHAALKQLLFSSEIGVARKDEAPVGHSAKSTVAEANYTIEVVLSM